MSIAELLISIANKVKSIKDNVLAAYDAVASKDGKVPIDKTTTNLIAAINSIPAQRVARLDRDGELGNRTLFIDFDGTPLFAYEPEEILALEELPIPYTSHERLTFVKWNYTLEEIKERVQVFGSIDVGAMYVPTDGWGEMEIEIGGNIPQFTPHFRMWLQDEGVLTMDWGDGTIEEYNGTDLDVRHTYAEVGKYLVRFISTTSYRGLYTYNDTKALVVGRFVFPTNATYVGANSEDINQKSGGNNPEENNASWRDPQCLGYTMVETLVLPPNCNVGVGNLGSGLTHMFRLKSIVSDNREHIWRAYDKSFPSCRYFSVREKNDGYGGTYGIKKWFINARSYFFGYTDVNNRYTIDTFCPNLERIVGDVLLVASNTGKTTLPMIKSLPTVVSYQEDYWANQGITELYNCVTFPQSYKDGVYPYLVNLNGNTLIKDYNCIFTTGSGNRYGLFQYNTSLQTLSLQASDKVRTLQANALLNCYSLKELHLVYVEGQDTTIVTLANVNAFSGCPSDLKIYVPAELVDAYKTATNWSTYADQIFAEPEVESAE